MTVLDKVLDRCRTHRAKANQFAKTLGLPTFHPDKPETVKEAKALESDLAYLRWELGGRLRFRTQREKEFKAWEEPVKQARISGCPELIAKANSPEELFDLIEQKLHGLEQTARGILRSINKLERELGCDMRTEVNDLKGANAPGLKRTIRLLEGIRRELGTQLRASSAKAAS